MGSSTGNRNKIESRIQELHKIKEMIQKEKEQLQIKLDAKNEVDNKSDNKISKNGSDNPNAFNKDYFMDHIFPDQEHDLLPNGKKKFLNSKKKYMKSNHQLDDISDDSYSSKQRSIREEEIVYVDQLDQDIIDII